MSVISCQTEAFSQRFNHSSFAHYSLALYVNKNNIRTNLTTHFVPKLALFVTILDNNIRFTFDVMLRLFSVWFGQSHYTGRIQINVLTTLPLKFYVFYDKNLFSFNLKRQFREDINYITIGNQSRCWSVRY